MSVPYPANYVMYGVTNNGNTLTLVRSNSSSEKPRFLEITRTPAVYNQAQKEFSIPTVSIRVWHGTIDADGKPRPQKIAWQETIRAPIGTEGAELAEILADLNALTAHANFITDVVQKQLMPEPV